VAELAEAAPGSQHQPWSPLVDAPRKGVTGWQRGAHAFVVILPRTAR